jgi:hypothetical protein
VSLPTRERIKTYYVEHGRHFDVMPDVGDLASAQRLFPWMDIDDASHMIYHLPGALQAGTAQLLRVGKRKSARCSATLSGWCERVPVRNPATGGTLGRIPESAVQAQFTAKRVQ